MTKQLIETMEKLTQEELSEVEMFVKFLIVKRNFKNIEYVPDEISVKEIMKVAEISGSFDWLSSPKEDVYSINDGKAVTW